MAARVLLTTPAGAPLSLRTASLQTSQLVRRAENPISRLHLAYIYPYISPI